MEKAKIGFIGIGIMGRPMALNLLKAGYPLVVFNRTRSRAEELTSHGAELADSPAEVARHTQVIITIVSDSSAVRDVIAGPDGVLVGVQPDSLVIDMSTISPEVDRDLDVQLRARGASLLDAPVSGGDVGAQKGTLAIMAGGERSDFERALPIFQILGKTITLCGPVGSGQLTKLCNQILVSINLLGVSEALVFARRNDLDPAIMIEAIQGGAAASWQLSNLGPRVIAGNYDPGFMIDLVQKDLKIVLETASRSATSLPATSLVHQLFNSAQAKGNGREGTQALAKVVAALSDC